MFVPCYRLMNSSVKHGLSKSCLQELLALQCHEKFLQQNINKHADV